MNKLTLLIDGGWFLMSRFGGMRDMFLKTLSKEQLNYSENKFLVMLWSSLYKFLKLLPEVDNLVMCCEGGSWRKFEDIPEQLCGTYYKGNREKSETEHDWASVYRAFDRFINGLSECGVTISQGSGIEGDDWMWWWSNKLNSSKISTIILTSDADIKQLIRMEEGIFTAWWNEKNGLVLPFECKDNLLNTIDDLINFQMYDYTKHNELLESIRKRTHKEDFINPSYIVMSKTISGDSSDNIKPCARIVKNNKKYGIGEKTCERVLHEIGDPENISQFIERFDMIACEIPRKIPMFKNYDCALIREMLDYNLKMVWLDSSTIPQKIQDKMELCEYKKIDIKKLKNIISAKISEIERDYPTYNKTDEITQENVEDLFK